MRPSPPPTTAPIIKFTQETVLATLSSYAADWPRALDFHGYVSSPPHNFVHTPSTLSLTISILSKHLEFPRARSLLLSSSTPGSDSTLPLRSLLDGLSAAHLVSDAISLFHESGSSRSLTSYHHLIDALCEHRHVSDAQSLALDSPRPPFPADTKIHNLILRGWLKSRSFSQCRLFWSLMDRKGIPKDLHSYSIYMDVLTKSGKPRKAVKMFRELRKDRALDVVAYNTAIQAAGLAGGADEGIGAFREMVDAGCPPNPVSWNTVIRLLCREGRTKEAYGWMGEMRRKGCKPDAITYHCFFKYCTRPNEVLWLFESMVGSGCRPRMDTYVMLLKKFGRWGFLRPVFMVWNKMEELGVSPDGFAYNAMIDALLEKGMVDLARAYDEEMLEKGLSPKPRKELGTRFLGEGGREDDDDNAFSGVL